MPGYRLLIANQTGEPRESRFASDGRAEDWARRQLVAMGYDAESIVFGEWEASAGDGQRERKWVWASAEDASEDAGGRKSIASMELEF
jgi:hypothetical protein